MLIVSLPPIHQTDLLRSIIESPIVDGVRYNTGMSSPRNPYDTLGQIKTISDPLGKPVYVDLKGKQLRITEWARVPYGPIVLNHKIEVELPAKVYFRGDDVCELKEVVNGNQIYVDPTPKFCVGSGQSINIVSNNLEIEEGLLMLDYTYIRAALNLGITRFMLSFVESTEDVKELHREIMTYARSEAAADECEIVFKIESKKGLEFVKNDLTSTNFSDDSRYQLMAARDDLMIQIGVLEMREALKLIAEKDPRAICASRLLMGLEGEEKQVSMADVSDIEYMRNLGYKNFMLSDGISHRRSNEALDFWQKYIKARPFA